MWSAVEERDVLSFNINLTYSLFSFPAVQSKVRVTGCKNGPLSAAPNTPQRRAHHWMPPHQVMPCASKLPTHSPASFHLLCSCECGTLAAGDDSLIPGERPPLLRPTFGGVDRRRSDRGERSGNPRSALRFLGAVKRFVQSIQSWPSFPCFTLKLVFGVDVFR